MTLERCLTYGMSGADVRAVKELLHTLGYYDAGIAAIRTNSFGLDTRRAVRRFQAEHGLATDGIVGPLTFDALQHASEKAGLQQADVAPDAAGPGATASDAAASALPLPAGIGQTAAAILRPALAKTTETRRKLVLDALSFAFDPAVPAPYPTSLYIRGGNLYGTDLLPNVITLARIAAGAKRQPQYYDGGRKELMERAVRANPAITGADCSGGVVGLLRHAGVVKLGYDLSADGFRGSGSYRSIERSALSPGDIVHKSGHVGLFVGGGYVVEWMGGAYGCQLTKLSDRRGYSFLRKRTGRMGAWTGFLRPTYY